MSRSAEAAPFKVFMITSTASDHLAMSAAARMALPVMGMANDFTVDATTDSSLINEANLAKYDVFLQMHRAPFEIELSERAALENFIKSGKGWVGVHAAGLIIPSAYTGRNLPDWPFYSDLIGRVTYVTHPALQNGTVIMEDRTHPATMNMPAMFQIRDEWYEFSGNPRANVRVLGKADESTYTQVRRMGDHPLIWTIDKYPRVIYTATGHDASDWQNAAFNILIRDSLLWAAGRLGGPVDGGATDGGATDAAASDAVAPVDAPAPAEAGAGGSGGNGAGTGGSSGSGGAQTADAGAGGATGSGGSASGSGGSGGAQATGGASGSGGGSKPSSGGGCAVAAGAGAGAADASLLALLGLAWMVRRRLRRHSSAVTISSLVLFGLLVTGVGCGGGDAQPGVDAGGGQDRPTSTTDTSSPVDRAAEDLPRDMAADTDVPSNPVDTGGGSPDVPAGTDTAADTGSADVALPKINALAIGELMTNGQPEIHAPFVQAAKPWLAQLAAETGMTITHIESPNTITDALLANYNLILQLNYPPFRWNATARAAFEKYMTEGKGGWVGLHHAALYGPAVMPNGETPWTWFFTNLLGGINYRNYIASFVQATVRVEEPAHPIWKDVPATFSVMTEEWYIWDKSPRANVRVLGNVDESTYMPNSTIKMNGDHPVVWTNDTVRAKNVYIFMGHHPNLFQNTAWTTMFKNAIFWAATPR